MTRLLCASVLCCALFAAGLARAEEPTVGAELYAMHCAGCHGHGGEGDGPLAGTTQIAVPNLRTLKMRSGNVFPADAVTAYIDGRRTAGAHGDRLMPVWGDVFQAETRVNKKDVRGRIAAIVAFIAELQYPD